MSSNGNRPAHIPLSLIVLWATSFLAIAPVSSQSIDETYKQALKEGGAGLEASARAGMKKAELATLAATKLAGKGWLPEPLKVAACT